MNEMFQKNVTGMGCMQINKLAAPFQCLFKCFLLKKENIKTQPQEIQLQHCNVGMRRGREAYFLLLCPPTCLSGRRYIVEALCTMPLNVP